MVDIRVWALEDHEISVWESIICDGLTTKAAGATSTSHTEKSVEA